MIVDDEDEQDTGDGPQLGAGAWLGPAMACLARDTLVDRALKGDEKALLLLIQACPTDLPKRLVISFRDGEIRRLGSGIASAHTDFSERRVAGILVAAGERRLPKKQRAIDGTGPFTDLDADNRAALQAAVDDLLRYSRSWPRLTKMREILAG